MSEHPLAVDLLDALPANLLEDERILSQADLMPMTEQPDPEERPLEAAAYQHRLTTMPDDVDERCEFCGREAVAEGPVTIGGRFFPFEPLCEICFVPPETHERVKDEGLLCHYDDDALGHVDAEA